MTNIEYNEQVESYYKTVRELEDVISGVFFKDFENRDEYSINHVTMVRPYICRTDQKCLGVEIHASSFYLDQASQYFEILIESTSPTDHFYKFIMDTLKDSDLLRNIKRFTFDLGVGHAIQCNKSLVVALKECKTLVDFDDI